MATLDQGGNQRMPLVVQQNEAADPTDVGVFGAQREVPQPFTAQRGSEQ